MYIFDCKSYIAMYVWCYNAGNAVGRAALQKEGCVCSVAVGVDAKNIYVICENVTQRIFGGQKRLRSTKGDRIIHQRAGGFWCQLPECYEDVRLKELNSKTYIIYIVALTHQTSAHTCEVGIKILSPFKGSRTFLPSP